MNIPDWGGGGRVIVEMRRVHKIRY